jgi:hypothetical protein
MHCIFSACDTKYVMKHVGLQCTISYLLLLWQYTMTNSTTKETRRQWSVRAGSENLKGMYTLYKDKWASLRCGMAYHLPTLTTTYQTFACDNFKWYYIHEMNRDTGLKQWGHYRASFFPNRVYTSYLWRNDILDPWLLCYGVVTMSGIFTLIFVGSQALKSCFRTSSHAIIDKNSTGYLPRGENPKNHLKKVDFTGRGLHQPIQHVDTRNDDDSFFPSRGLLFIL